MKWLESTIAAVSPQTARDRAVARLQLQAANSYEGAKRSRRNENWGTRSFSPNEELKWDLETLRDRSRDLVRNNPYAPKAVNSIVGSMVGTGIMPIIGGENAQKISDLWNWFTDSADFEGDTDLYGIQAMAGRGMVGDGESITVFRPAPSWMNLKIPLQLQVLESDHLDGRKDVQNHNRGRIIQGVELDGQGRKRGYHLFDQHPGDRYRKQESRFIQASDVLFMFEKLRAGQLRAVSWFAPVMLTIKDFGDYQSAELMAKKIQACTGMWIEMSGEGTAGAVQTIAGSDGKTRRQEKFEPGMVLYGQPGEKATLLTPQISQGYAEYTKSRLQAIAAGLGITYEQLSGDLSNVNYSSFRAGHLEFRQRMESLRWHLWVPRFCNPTWYRFAQLARALHNVEVPLWVDWTPPAYQSVDLIKDYKAMVIACRAGITSLQRGIGQFGENPHQILNEMEEWNAQLDAKGVVLDTDPRKRTMTGGAITDVDSPAPEKSEEDENA